MEVTIMSKRLVVKLQDVADELEAVNMDTTIYLNCDTGEFIFWNPDYMDDADEIGEKIDASNCISLPSQFDIHEYKMMEEYTKSVVDMKKQDQLFRAISGKGAFRRFKDTVAYIGLREAWFEFRQAAYLEVARRWCEDHDIEYIE